MSALKHNLIEKIIYFLLAALSVGSFWLINQYSTINYIVTILLIPLIFTIFLGKGSFFNAIILSFIISYALNGYLLVFNLPLWIIILSSLIIFGYLFKHIEDDLNIEKTQKTIYLALFSLVVSELFLFLSYFLINPINTSLIIALFVYLFAGYLKEETTHQKMTVFFKYLLVFLVAFVMMILTASWGG